MGEPWYFLHGRADKWHSDVSGPSFKTQAEMNEFISKNKLKICGVQ
jgi:hypothetical protein